MFKIIINTRVKYQEVNMTIQEGLKQKKSEKVTSMGVLVGQKLVVIVLLFVITNPKSGKTEVQFCFLIHKK